MQLPALPEVAFDAQGNLVPEVAFDAQGNLVIQQSSVEVALDAEGNLVILESSQDADGGLSQILKRYKTDGTLLSSVNLTLGLYVDSTLGLYLSRPMPLSNGDVLAVGGYPPWGDSEPHGPPPPRDLVRINPVAGLVWQHRTAAGIGDIAVGRADEAHVATSETTRFAVAKLDERGATAWEWTSPPRLDWRDREGPPWIRLDRRGNTYAFSWQLAWREEQYTYIHRIYRFRPDGELCGVSRVSGVSCGSGDQRYSRGQCGPMSFAVGPSGEMTVLVQSEAGDWTVRRVK